MPAVIIAQQQSSSTAAAAVAPLPFLVETSTAKIIRIKNAVFKPPTSTATTTVAEKQNQHRQDFKNVAVSFSETIAAHGIYEQLCTACCSGSGAPHYSHGELA
ncbi:hypothetical protein HK100_007202 [Physocladia obscura]|uniref:Uncharacterized protein n=1 Tax=Physocladia obscura TaxID=109957 RepID=A0AAD5SR01_9FUNG|nr:hypothetical protein HK100_007202 [Physocladia obscura]